MKALIEAYRKPTPNGLNTQQAMNQVVFLLCGKLILNIGVTWQEILTALLCGAIVDNVALRIRMGSWQPFNVASLVAPMAVCIMLRSDTSWVLPLAACVGLLSKHLVRVNGRHFHNPSNVAILFALLAFPADTTIQRIDWGHLPWMVAIITVAGLLLTTRARVFDNSLIYHLTLGTLVYLLVSKNPDRIVFQLTSGSVLLYSFFIQNDPRVLPRSRLFRYAFVIMAASGQVALQLTWGAKDVNTMLSLATASMFVPLFRQVEEAWTSPGARLLTSSVAYGAPLAVLLALYHSDFNFKRNLRTSMTTAKAAQAGEAERIRIAYESVPWHSPTRKQATQSELEGLVAGRFQSARTDLFKTRWNESHLVSVPFRSVPRRPLAFTREVGNLEISSPMPGLDWVGEDNYLFASVTAGDIDHDGFLDIVLGSPPYPVSIFLNDGSGNFVDVASVLFEKEVPAHIEHVALVDIDSDSWLDLVLARSHYRAGKTSSVWRFDPDTRKFRQTPLVFGAGKKSAGGLSFVDLNQDRQLDFYISYGVDRESESVNYMNLCSRDEFYLSTGGLKWKNAYEEVFPPNMTKYSLAGMTALFAHLDGDAKVDFLIGNDYNHPSMVAFGGRNGFKLTPRDFIEVNTQDSMSYFPIDFDGDGQDELWENGTAFDFSTAWIKGRMAEQSRAKMSLYDEELINHMVSRVKGKLRCSEFKDPRVIALCRRDLLNSEAAAASDEKACDRHVNPVERARCKRFVRHVTKTEYVDPSMEQYNVELFPKQMPENTLLKFNASSNRYERIRIGRDVEFTSWSWAAYPFDVDNDGRVDLHVATGYFGDAHTRNRLLHNTSEPGRIALRDIAGELQIDVLDTGSGSVIADLDNDGDGEIVVNGALIQPVYWRNQTGGKALEIELRSKRSNYYGLGSRIKVKTNKRIQSRQVWSGGVWASYQPPNVHFGLADDEQVQEVEITWPDGRTERRPGIEPGARWIVYE